MLRVGETIDRYEVLGELGDGGMATVYRVRDTVLKSEHALKVLAPELAADESLRERFLGEGRALAQLDHDNIVRVTNVVVVPGIAGLVQELLQGETLDELIERTGALDTETIKAIIGPVLSAVGYVHEQGIVHRDLKPSNIFLHHHGSQLRPVILDFGIARIASGGGVQHEKKHKTEVGRRLGTIAYMSPEQIRATAEVGHRSDIYSLGAVLFEMATGQVAFDGGSEYDVMQAIVEGRFGDAGLLDQVEPSIAGVIERALSPDPAGRFSDCDEMARALASGRVGPGRAVRRSPSPKAPVGLLALILVPIVLAGVALVVWVARPDQVASPTAGAETVTPAPPTPAPTPDPGEEERRIERQVQEALDRRQADLDRQTAELEEREEALRRQRQATPTPPPAPIRNLGIERLDTSSVYSSSNARTLRYDAAVANDGDPATWWSEGVAGFGRGEWLRAHINSAEVHEVRLIPGYDKVKRDSYGDRWTLNNRLKRVEISFSEGTSFAVNLPDRRGWHSISLPSPVRTSWVRVTILGVHPGKADDSGIAEIEIRGRP